MQRGPWIVQLAANTKKTWNLFFWFEIFSRKFFEHAIPGKCNGREKAVDPSPSSSSSEKFCETFSKNKEIGLGPL